MKNFFRISDWKDTHLILVFTGFFIWINYYQVNEFEFFLKTFTFLVISTLLMGCFGYYINDLFDIQKDKKVGKNNFAAIHKPIFRILIPFILLFLIYASWYILNKQQTILCLLISEVGLFLLYSLPKIRLKEIPILSVVIDSLYAYTLWGVFNLFLVANITVDEFEITQIIYLIWLFILGARGVLSHHIFDYQKDIKSKTRTSATRFGLNNIRAIKTVILFPIELILLIAFLFFINKYLILIFLLYVALTFFNSYINKTRTFRINLLSFVDKFYYVCLPNVALIFLIFVNPKFLFFAPFFILFFFGRVKDFVLDIYSWIFRVGSLVVNYSLYFTFLLVGKDLKKRVKTKNKYKQSSSEFKKVEPK